MLLAVERLRSPPVVQSGAEEMLLRRVVRSGPAGGEFLRPVVQSGPVDGEFLRPVVLSVARGGEGQRNEGACPRPWPRLCIRSSSKCWIRNGSCGWSLDPGSGRRPPSDWGRSALLLLLLAPPAAPPPECCGYCCCCGEEDGGGRPPFCWCGATAPPLLLRRWRL